jgi:hypothetical protein
MKLITRQALITLLTSIMLLSVGCGPKSGKSKNRIPQAPDTVESSQPGQSERPRPSQNEDRSFERDQSYNNDEFQQQNRGESVRINTERARESDDDGYLYEEDYGKSYDRYDKDQFHDTPTQTVASGDRFGEFGAVMFDDPMWYPGLPDYPAGHPQSKISKVYTGGVSESGYKFTDGKSDGLMAFAVKQFDQLNMATKDQVHADVREESRKLAEKIMEVNLVVDTYSTSSLKLEVKFADGDVSNPVKVLFHGKLDAQRQSVLSQVNIAGDKDLKFSADVICMDQDGGCQNAIIRMAQWKDGKICRVANVVHRFGDAHMTMSESDRLHYSASPSLNYQRLAEYLSNTSYNACLANKGRKDVPNRLTQHLLAYCGDGKGKKLPAAKTIGLKTWSAAYGASEFKIYLTDEAHWTGYNTGAASAICGPLVHADQKNPIYSNKLSKAGSLSPYIKSAHLVNNDGGGNLNILLRTSGNDESELRLSITSMIRNTIYPEELPEQEVLKEDPRG